MTLLELLVKELPERGGWPEDVWHVTQDSDGQVNGYGDSEPHKNHGGVWTAHGFISYLSDDERMFLCEDYATAIVTREQYESAIAAQQPAWNGEGLPPVGCKCEREVPRGWSRCRINYVSSSLIVYQMLDSGNEYASTLSAFKFRPIRTEEDRKRCEVINAIALAYDTQDESGNYRAAAGVYEDIESGKIPFVELTK